MKRAAAILLAALMLGGSLVAYADYTDDPDLAAKDEDYAAARKAIAAKQWHEAVGFLKKTERRNPDHADVQNSLGYSYRNLKQYDLAFTHYKRALEIDPRHRGAHEYIGETYLLVGDLKGAERHLAALREICLLPCDELADLEKAIANYRR